MILIVPKGHHLKSLLFSLSILTLAFFLITTVGSTTIPLLYRFGAERARLLMVCATLVPAAIGFGLYYVLRFLGFTPALIEPLLWLSPLAALLWDGAMFCLSCRIFQTQEAA